MSNVSRKMTKAAEANLNCAPIQRASARCSKGPKTEEEKAQPSCNATVTGLTGRPMLLASDEIDQYTLHLSRHHAEYLPITEAESELVQSIADCEWRLRRILTLEAGIYGLGERQFASHFADESREVRKALIKAQTLLVYQGQLSNLSIQESRLQHQKEKHIAALEMLKSNRPHTPAGVSLVVPMSVAAAGSSAIGFEFTHWSEDPSSGSFFPQALLQRTPLNNPHN